MNKLDRIRQAYLVVLITEKLFNLIIKVLHLVGMANNYNQGRKKDFYAIT